MERQIELYIASIKIWRDNMRRLELPRSRLVHHFWAIKHCNEMIYFYKDRLKERGTPWKMNAQS